MRSTAASSIGTTRVSQSNSSISDPAVSKGGGCTAMVTDAKRRHLSIDGVGAAVALGLVVRAEPVRRPLVVHPHPAGAALLDPPASADADPSLHRPDGGGWTARLLQRSYDRRVPHARCRCSVRVSAAASGLVECTGPLLPRTVRCTDDEQPEPQADSCLPTPPVGFLAVRRTRSTSGKGSGRRTSRTRRSGRGCGGRTMRG